MNLANKITLIRIILIPIFMFFLVPLPDWLIGNTFFKDFLPLMNFISKYGNYIAAGIFIIAASTDAVDGYIARSRNMITNLGKFLDPIADKLLVTAALVALVERNEVSTWIAMIIIAREFVVTGFRLIAAGEGVVMAAGYLGKVKMVVQTVAVVLLLLNNFPFSQFVTFPFDEAAVYLAVIITIYSGIEYIFVNRRVLKIEVLSKK